MYIVYCEINVLHISVITKIILFIIALLAGCSAAFGFAQAMVESRVVDKENFPVAFICCLALLLLTVVILSREVKEIEEGSSQKSSP